MELNLTPDARALRRELGPLVWAVLEDIAMDAQPVGGEFVAETNVRRLAANLGVSKDTVARALRRLDDRSLVTRRPARRELGGTFAPATYALAQQVVALVINMKDHPTGPKTSTPRTRRATSSSQRSLFEAQASS